MCLVSVLPKGRPKYSDEVIQFIKSGMLCNEEGSGFMFKRDGEKQITIDKGYFKIDSLLEAYKSYELKDEDEVVIHHRISTLGLVSPENCHPFVVSKHHDTCSSTNIVTDKPCLAHNGQFHKLDYYESLDSDFSDTYAFARWVMSDANIMNLLLEDENLFDLVMRPIIGTSRVVIMFPDKPTKVLGVFEKSNGYLHSNMGYCRYVTNRGGVESGSNSRVGSSFTPHKWGAQDWSEGHSNNEDWYEDDEFNADDDTPNDASTEYEADWEDMRQFAEHRKEYEEYKAKQRLLLLSAATQGAKPGDEKFPEVVISKDMVTISKLNYNHFFYVPKNEYSEMCRRKQWVLGTLDIYDSSAEFQSMKEDWSNGVSKGTRYEGVTTGKLHNNYLYIPKPEYVARYREFYSLLANVEIGTKTYKRLCKLLSKATNIRKSDDDRIMYHKTGTFQTKGALKLLRDHMYTKYVLPKVMNNVELVSEEEEAM